MNKIITVILFLLVSSQLFSQGFTVEKYIDRYKSVAIEEMRRSGIPASITLAQGILESENGNGSLTLRSNNHFGIKCKSSWTGETVYHNDDEQGECFRKYSNPEESYRDHSDFLKTSDRYSLLFTLDPINYKGWAFGLKKAGYATNPRYPQILINYIEKYNLQQYTLLGMTPADDNITAVDKLQYEALPTKLDQTGEPQLVKTQHFGLNAVHVSRGTSLLAVASGFDIPLYRLMEFNDLISEGILTKDQWLYLERKNKTAEVPVHTTASGETIYDIAQYYGVQLSSILKYNNMDKDALTAPGTVIHLQPTESKAVADIIHEVRPKESLFSISKKYDVSISTLKVLNKLSSDDLTVGQRLIISNK